MPETAGKKRRAKTKEQTRIVNHIVATLGYCRMEFDRDDKTSSDYWLIYPLLRARDVPRNPILAGVLEWMASNGVSFDASDKHLTLWERTEKAKPTADLTCCLVIIIKGHQ